MIFEFIRIRIGNLSDTYTWLHEWMQAIETQREFINASRKWVQGTIASALDFSVSHKYKITPVSAAYAVPIPTNTQDGDTGQIKIRGGSGSVTWGATSGDLAWDIDVDVPPVLPTDDSECLIVSWTREADLFHAVYVTRDWS